MINYGTYGSEFFDDLSVSKIRLDKITMKSIFCATELEEDRNCFYFLFEGALIKQIYEKDIKIMPDIYLEKENDGAEKSNCRDKKNNKDNFFSMKSFFNSLSFDIDKISDENKDLIFSIKKIFYLIKNGQGAEVAIVDDMGNILFLKNAHFNLYLKSKNKLFDSLVKSGDEQANLNYIDENIEHGLKVIELMRPQLNILNEKEMISDALHANKKKKVADKSLGKI